MKRVRALVAAVVALPTLLTASPVSADAPVAAGWWNLAHQSVEPPRPPDVGETDLLLQSGPGAPSAYAAVRFLVPAGATVGPLQLPLAASRGQRADAVTACPVTKDWQPVHNGRYADAPSYSCVRSSRGVLTPDGAALVFPDIVRLVRDDGRLDVALLPGPADRVVLVAPPATALTVTPVAARVEPPPAAPSEPRTTPAGDVTPPADVSGPPLSPVDLAAPPPVMPAPVPVPDLPALSPALPAPAPPATTRASAQSRVDDSFTRWLLLAEGLLVLAFFGLLGAGPLARLAPLTGAPIPVAGRPRGVGRFAQVRPSGRPPRL